MWSLRGLSIGELLKRTIVKSWDDEVFGQSGRLAFYFFFSMFPLILLLVLFSKATATGAEWQESLLRAISQVLPADAASLVIFTIRQLNGTHLAGSGFAFVGLGVLWGTVNGTWAIMTGLNNAYEIEEKRSFPRVLGVACGLTVCLCTVAIIALVLLSGADRVIHSTALLPLVRWAVLAALLLVSFAVLYRFGPNLHDNRWQWSIPGALIAVTLWLTFSLGLRSYQAHVPSSQKIYAGLSAIATLLIWLYLTGGALFIGGEANSEIEQAAVEARHPDVGAGTLRRSPHAREAGR
jgi:membrane protein